MSALSIQPTYPIFTDTTGQPLENGYIWIGTTNLNPVTNPITVYWDAALTVPASQPIRTLNGYPSNSGTPSRLYVNSDYSIQVLNKNGSVVYSAPAATEQLPSYVVTFIQSGTGAVATTVQAKLRETVSVLDFGADPTGTSDSSTAFLNAMLAAYSVFVPEGTYNVDASNSGGCRITSGSGYHLFGEGEKSVIRRGSYNPSNKNIDFDSGGAAVFIDDVKISNLKFLGDVATLGHNELYGSMLVMSGVRRAIVENCYFEGPRCDAISLNSGPGGPTSERHNFDVTIRNCVFNGVVYGVDGGRNAISVIDVDGMLIEGNSFRNWSRNDMPGSIDFEPNYSFGVIKNVRVCNNKFTNTAGTAGHVAFACDNIPTANQQNWVITGNEFSGATGTFGAAIYLLTEKTAPSVPSTNGQNIVISNNTASNCNWFVDKFKGSVNGITIANNVVNFSTASQGAIRFADGTIDWTLTDAIITGNSLVTTINIPVSITDNIVNLVFSNNIMRGATQAHTRWGQSGSSTTNISMLNNVFLGAPAVGDCQHDATTTNPVTNVYLGNIAPVGQSTRFRAFKTDNSGNVLNLYEATALPNTFPRGVSVSTIFNRTVAAPNQSGMLYTYRQSDTAEAVYQVFVSQYSATELDDMYFRKAIDATNWAAWFRVTGV
jgi:hypothetical protein